MDWGICQLVNCLLLKHEGLSSLLSTHVKMSTRACIYNPSVREAETGEPLGLLAHQYSQVRSSRSSGRPCHKITKGDSNWEGHPTLTSGLDMYPEAHVYAHTQENPAFICHLSTFQSSPEDVLPWKALFATQWEPASNRQKERERKNQSQETIYFI